MNTRSAVQPTIPLTQKIRAAYESLSDKLQAAFDGNKNYTFRVNIISWKTDVDNILEKDAMYRFATKPELFTALLVQIKSTNIELDRIKRQFTVLVAHIALADEILFAISRVLELVPNDGTVLLAGPLLKDFDLAFTKSTPPSVFISYSWDKDPSHNRWVTRLAERLRSEHGLDVKFDRWHLNPGDDKNRFMESAIKDSQFVIVVCTPTYAERANERQGGVGYESTIITAELASQMKKGKLIPLLRSGDWISSLPIYLGNILGVDLRSDPYSEEEYTKLVRALYKHPITPPPLGNRPNFL